MLNLNSISCFREAFSSAFISDYQPREFNVTTIKVTKEIINYSRNGIALEAYKRDKLV